MGKKQLSVIVALLICIFLPHAVLAELYGWIDENGVKHFSNYPPPEGVKSFRHTLEIQSKATDADVQKNIRQQNQHSAPTPSDKDVSGKSVQGDGIPQDDNVTSDNVTSDVDWIRRGAYKRHEKRKQHERREERREERANENLDRGENHKEEKQEPGKEVKQDRQEEPVKREAQYREPEKKKHRPKK